MVEALGDRVPIATAGRFTLYTRTKSPASRWIHDKRNGPDSMPVASLSEQFGVWRSWIGDEQFNAQDPLEVFRWWVDQQGSSSTGTVPS